MPEMPGNAWLPTWLGIAATAVFVVVLAVHLRHLAGGTRGGRAWHTGHVLMALGMIDMFLPTSGMIVSAVIGEVVFALAAVSVGGFVVSRLVRRGRVSWLWPITGVDLAAMAYMFAMPSVRFGWLTGLLVAWFVGQALGWIIGRLSAIADAATAEPTDIAGHHLATGAGVAAPGATTERATPATVAHSSAHSLSIRATLTVMSLGMGYMFLAMQLGMTHMAGNM
jgi:Domain of unknown function (DUF5134)